MGWGWGGGGGGGVGGFFSTRAKLREGRKGGGVYNEPARKVRGCYVCAHAQVYAHFVQALFFQTASAQTLTHQYILPSKFM